MLPEIENQKRQMRKSLLLSGLLCLLMASCKTSGADSQEGGVRIAGDTVFLQESSPINQKIQIDTTRFSPLETTYSTVGTVRAEAGKLAEVAAPMDGRPTKCFVRLGQHVNAGQPLFGFHSADFADIAKEYYQSKAAYEQGQKNLKRKESLRESGIVSEREMEEARTEEEVLRKDMIRWQQALEVMGVDPENPGNGGSFRIIAPISGEVVKAEVTPGQLVGADDEALIVIADLKQVWVVARLKEYYLDCISQDDSVEVVIDGHKNFHCPGRIVYIGQLVDEATRSVDVLVECDNYEKTLKPGMFAHVHFTGKGQEGICLPASAVMQGDEETYVYTVARDGVFVRRDVIVESGEEGQIYVMSGLEAGERVVVSGGIYLSE